MEKLALRYNTDFELSLFDSNYNANTPKSRSMVEEFEYFLFWLESGAEVYSKKYYSEEYLEYIKNETGFLPTFNNESYRDYISNSEDIALNRVLSNKVTFYQFLEKTLDFQIADFKIIKNVSDINAREINYPVIIKNPYLFSGMGNIKINNYLEFESFRTKIEMWLQQGDIIIEKFVLKKMDIGVQIENEEMTVYENIIGKQFQYQGSQTLESPLRELIISKSKIIYEYYQKLGLKGNMAIDLMVTDDDHLYFHEVNPRKSMGHVFKKLNQKFNQKNLKSGLYIYPSKKLNYFKCLNDLISELPKNIKMLSPLSTNTFVSFFIVNESSEGLRDIKQKLEDIILKR